MSIIQGSAMQGASRGFYPKEIQGSLRLNDDDSAYLSWTPDSAGNRKTWTWSAWVKRGNLGSTMGLFSSDGTTDSTKFELFISSGDQLGAQGSSTTFFRTNQVFRDPSAWYHIVVVWDATNTTAEVYVNGDEVTSWSTSPNVSNQNYGINNEVEHYLGSRDGGGNSWDGYLAEVFFIDGTAHDADAFGETKNGVWVPRNITASDFTMGTNGFHLTFEDDTEVEAFNTVLYEGTGKQLSVTGTGFTPDLVWCKRRDSNPSHSLQDSVRGPRGRLFSDTTAAEDQNSGVISFDSDGFTIDGTKNATGSNGSDYVAWCWDAGANNASTGHSSVTYTGAITGTESQTISGLPFQPDLLWIKRRDSSNSHRLFDSVRGSNNYLESNGTGAEASDTTNGTIDSFQPNGFIVDGGSTNSNPLAESGATYVAWAWDAGDSDPVSNTDGDITATVKTNGDFSIISYTGSGGSNHTIGHGLSAEPDFLIVKDRDSNSVNNNWSIWHRGLSSDTHNLYFTNGAEGDVTGGGSHGGIGDVTTTTFKAVDGSVDNKTANESGDDYIAYAWRNVTGKQKFDKYVGTGSTGLSVTTGFRPGFLMIKASSTSGERWEMLDASRSPFDMDVKVAANESTAEVSLSGHIDITDTGFVINDTTGGYNTSGVTYIYAAFAGSYSDFITDYNTDGTNIDSRVKASDTTGFSICSYEGSGTAGDSFGHGLSSAPDWIVIKSRDEARNWLVYHSGNTSEPETERLILDGTQATADSNVYWNDTAPTSSVVTLGNDNLCNASGESYIAYCWTATTGVSAFGSYTGSGSTGNSVTGLGFKPAWLMVKKTEDTNGSWRIFDATRSTTDDRNDNLFANLSNAESVDSNGGVSFDSDGFTLNNTGSANANQSGKNYIYAAFADTREAAFWLDQSSNDNDWQPVNLDHNDTVADSPTNNFATLNPLSVPSSPSRTFSDGNLRFDATTNNAKALGTILLPASGQWYWEATQLGGTTTATIGVADANYNNETTGRIGYRNDGNKIDETNTVSSYGTTYQSGDTIGVAFDADADTLTFYKNGTSQGTAFTGMAARSDNGLVPFVQAYTTTPFEFNFGQQPFKYSPPE